MPVGLVGKDGAKVSNNVHDPKDKAAGGVETREIQRFIFIFFLLVKLEYVHHMKVQNILVLKKLPKKQLLFYWSVLTTDLMVISFVWCSLPSTHPPMHI